MYNFAKALQEDEDLKSQRALHRVMTTCFELFGKLSKKTPRLTYARRVD